MAAGKGDSTAVINCCDYRPELIESLNERKSAPLILASSNGYLSVAAYLIKKGANVNAANEHGRTSLNYASSNNHLDIARQVFHRQARRFAPI